MTTTITPMEQDSYVQRFTRIMSNPLLVDTYNAPLKQPTKNTLIKKACRSFKEYLLP